MRPYDPKSALRLVKDAMRSKPTVEVKGLLKADGKPVYEAAKRADTLCVLLLGFVHGTAVLPDDFDTVERSAKGLKAHVRPDGGVYLGAFQTPHDPAGVVVVYGDPLMEMQDAIRASLVFRKGVQAQMETFDSHKSLGPFAAQPEPSA